MDPFADPAFAEAEVRHDKLYTAFAARCTPEKRYIDLPALLEVFGEMGRCHPVCAEETEAFVKDALADADSTALPLFTVERLYNATINFQRGRSFPKANDLDADGKTAILRAAEAGDLALVDTLLGFGADPNAAATDGHDPAPSALYVACTHGHDGIARSLMFAQADPHCRVDAMGSTPLYIACHRGHAACVAEMLYGGANPNRSQRERAARLRPTVIAGACSACRTHRLPHARPYGRPGACPTSTRRSTGAPTAPMPPSSAITTPRNVGPVRSCIQAMAPPGCTWRPRVHTSASCASCSPAAPTPMRAHRRGIRRCTAPSRRALPPSSSAS